MPGGTGPQGETESRQVLAAVMGRVFVVNLAASMLGQAYGDLVRPAGSRVWSPPDEAIAVAMLSALAMLVLLTTPWARRRFATQFTLRHALIVGAVFLAGNAILRTLLPAEDFANRSRLETLAIDLPGGMLWVFAIAAFAWRRAQMAFGPDLQWLDTGSTPGEHERLSLVRLPARAAAFALPYWLVLATYNVVLNAWSPIGGVGAQGVFFGTMLTWLATAALIYLLSERLLRPVFARAFRAAPLPSRTAAGIRRRLLVAWTLGSGIPLFFVLVSPGALRQGHLLGDPDAVNFTFIFLGAVGLLAGFLTMRAAARSLADPMEQVRRGLARVREGDLSVELPIDDAGEVGSVKVGFNEMVAGLRERTMLEDLFGRHVGADVARRAIEQGTALGGEQRQATVFFVDLIGSTALAETCTPAEVVATLNRFFGAVVAAVGSEGGWVNKFEGDGALCVFGTPADEPDHAARALRAALALREALSPVADAGIGIATGEVVAGNVGAEERYEYTVIGRPVNAAARLTEEAKRRPSRVLATADVVKAAGGDPDAWISVGAVSLRGVAVPVVAFEPAPLVVR